MLRPLYPILALAILPDGAAAQTALPVEVVTVQAAARTVELRLVGTVEAANAYPGAFRTSGRILEIGYEAGDRVTEGAVIARVDAAQAEAALAGARAGVEAASASLTQAEQARDRARDLLQRGVGTRSQLDEAEQAYLAARARQTQAEAQAETAMQAVEDTVIRAGEDVIVLERLAQPGEIVGAGQAVLTLASDGRLDALFLTPDVTGLADLRNVDVTLAPDDGPSFRTTITEISPVVTDTGTVEVRAAIPPEAAAGLNIGEILEGAVNQLTAPVFTVPWTALTATGDGPAVWTVDPATMQVHLTPIVIASYEDNSVDISDGLADGAAVVGAGSQSLYDGMIVTPAEVAQ